MLGVLSDELIRLTLVLLAPTDERLGKAPRVAIDGMASPELVLVGRRIAGPVEVELVEKLQRDLSTFSALSHADA